LLALRSKSEVDDYQKEAEKRIENLTTSENTNENNTLQANNTEDTNHSNETGSSGTGNENDKINIQALKEQVISTIKATLTSPEPKLTNSDLGLKYQDWETKLNDFSEESEINY
jgi:hypothetical protein